MVNWETAEWTMYGLEVEEIPNEEFCHSGNELRVFASPKRDFETSVNFCKRLGGNLAVADNFNNADAMMNLFVEKGPNCTFTWTGYSDIKEEGKYVNVLTGEDLSWKNWLDGEPNGEKEENCAVIPLFNNPKRKIVDYDCTDNLCTICRFTETKMTKLKLRGACPEEELDINFQLLNIMKNERYLIRSKGWKTAELVWNEKKWEFVNLRSKKVIAYTNDTDDYPLGTHKWIFTDGRCTENNGEKYRRMKLHSCDKQEFSCEDGQCIDAAFRCDLEYNCADLSDEENCTMFTTPGYELNTPPPIISKGDGSQNLILVDVSIAIIAIIEINEMDSKINIKFILSTTWNDARIYFKSLQDDDKKNIISNYKTIWHPHVEISNAVSDFKEGDVVVIAKKHGKGCLLYTSPSPRDS